MRYRAIGKMLLTCDTFPDRAGMMGGSGCSLPGWLWLLASSQLCPHALGLCFTTHSSSVKIRRQFEGDYSLFHDAGPG